MSAYATFYLRTRQDELLELGTYSRSCEIYNIFSNIMDFGHIIPVRRKILSINIDVIEEKIGKTKEEIKTLEQNKALVPAFNNTIDEKMQCLNDYQEMIDDKQQYLKELTYTSHILIFLDDILCEAEYNYKYPTDGMYCPDPEHYLYIGLEASPLDSDCICW